MNLGMRITNYTFFFISGGLLFVVIWLIHFTYVYKTDEDFLREASLTNPAYNTLYTIFKSQGIKSNKIEKKVFKIGHKIFKINPKSLMKYSFGEEHMLYGQDVIKFYLWLD